MSITENDTELTTEEKIAYATGMNVMFDAFAIAFNRGVSFKDTINLHGSWIDDVLTPWYRYDLHVLNHKFKDLPILPDIELLQKNYKRIKDAE